MVLNGNIFGRIISSHFKHSYSVSFKNAYTPDCEKQTMEKIELFSHFMPFETTARFLTRLSEFGWNVGTKDVIMDIGCGPGKATATLIRPVFSNCKKIIAIDIQPKAIQIAKSKYSHPSIEYRIADIENSETGVRWKEQATKILSIFCFNWLKDQKTSFKNVYEILTPGGEAVLLFVLRSPLYDATLELSTSLKWSSLLKNAESTIPDSHFNKFDGEYYKSLMESIGFQVILCRDEEVENPLTTREDSENFFFSICTVSSQIPENLEKDFKRDLYESIKKHSKCNTEPMQSWIKNDIKLIVKKV